MSRENNNTSIHNQLLVKPTEPYYAPRKSQIVITRKANGGIKNIEVVSIPQSLGSSILDSSKNVLEQNPGARPTLIGDHQLGSAGNQFSKTDVIIVDNGSPVEVKTGYGNFQQSGVNFQPNIVTSKPLSVLHKFIYHPHNMLSF